MALEVALGFLEVLNSPLVAFLCLLLPPLNPEMLGLVLVSTPQSKTPKIPSLVATTTPAALGWGASRKAIYLQPPKTGLQSDRTGEPDLEPPEPRVVNEAALGSVSRHPHPSQRCDPTGEDAKAQ